MVDDGSPASLEPVVSPFHEELNVKLLTQTNAGPATARNTGAAHAKGKFLAFIDDDCAPDSVWLKALAYGISEAPEHMIWGRTLNILLDNLYSTASQQLISYLYDYYNGNPSEAGFFVSNNLVVPADQFCGVGGFNTTFSLPAGEDREFCYRWLQHGYKMTFAPEAVVYHAQTLRGFWCQHFNYGRGAFHFHQVRAQNGQGRINLEPLSFYLNLLRYRFSQTQGWRAFLITGLLVVSQTANAAGFLWERFFMKLTQGWGQIAGLP